MDKSFEKIVVHTKIFEHIQNKQIKLLNFYLIHGLLLKLESKKLKFGCTIEKKKERKKKENHLHTDVQLSCKLDKISGDLAEMCKLVKGQRVNLHDQT